MTLEQLHSFIRLVRKMHRVHKEALTGANGNLWTQYYSLSMKVDGKLLEFTSTTTIYYDWQSGFVNLVRELRKQRKEYDLAKHDAQLQRCKEMEAKLEYGIRILEQKWPLVFLSEKPAQQTLF